MHVFQVRTIQGLDIWALPTSTFDAWNFPPMYTVPVFEGPEPAATEDLEGDSGKLYTGSCHCGVVRLALRSKPLDESYSPDRMCECDCSVCIRVSNITYFPYLLPNYDAPPGHVLIAEPYHRRTATSGSIRNALKFRSRARPTSTEMWLATGSAG